MAPAETRRPRLTLRRTLTIIVVATVALMALFTVALSTLALRDSMISQLDASLQQASNRSTMSPHVGRDPVEPPTNDSETGDARPPALLGAGQNANTLSVYVSGQTIRAGYFDSTAEFHELTQTQQSELLALPTDDVARTVSVSDLGQYRAIATTDSQGNIVITALPLESVTSTVGRFVLVALAIGVGLAVLAALIGAYLVKRALRPLEAVANTAQRISQVPLGPGTVELSNRVAEPYTDSRTEVGKVGHSLNSMIDHIENALGAREASEKKLRSFVADASHELRTPLASIRGYAELLTRTSENLTQDEAQSLSRIESESERMSRLVDDLLLLARLDNSRELDDVPFDAAPLVIEVVADAHVVAPDHVWSLNLPGADSSELDEESDSEAASAATEARGDPNAYRQIVTNLVANARIHTPAGTRVTVSLAREGDDVVLTVADTGPGIPDSIRDTLFDRFVKGSESRSPGKGSSGLGLSICSALLAAQGGSLSVASEPGKTVFTARIPAATL